MKKAFGLLQQIGKSLMLPVSVLPVAGILLGVGSSKFSWIPEWLSLIMAKSGDAIFGNLPLIFAIGVGLGLTGNDGVSALAAVVGYLVMLGTMGVVANCLKDLTVGGGLLAPLGNLLGWGGAEIKPVMGIDSLNTGVLGGIIIGFVAANLFNRYYRIELPPYLGFFGGKRFVPIVTGLAAILTGCALSLVWPLLQGEIRQFGNWAANGNPLLAVFLYGTVERMLIPFGLHHIWNVPFFFEIGDFINPETHEHIHGDIHRFFAGDPTAGILGGGFLFKMWGLPAAAIAIWHSARPDRRVLVGGIMVSAALTSFLTGITEPIEFSFLFVAPLLYGVHALLAGIAFVVSYGLGARLGYTFSQGFIDYVLFFSKDTRPWLVLIAGPLYGLLYYTVFRVVIAKLDLPTPGREAEDETVDASQVSGGLAGAIVEALGGAANLTNLDACITRLRVGLKDMSLANPAQLKALGAAGVITVGNGLQAIFGTRSENIKTDIEILLRSGPVALPAAAPPASKLVAVDPADLPRARTVLAALGGSANVRSCQACAITRIRLEVVDAGKIDRTRLDMDVMVLSSNLLHLVGGVQSTEGLAAALEQVRKAG